MERYRLIIEAVPRNGVPATTRLKAALKCLLRSFGFRCRSITEDDSADKQRTHVNQDNKR